MYCNNKGSILIFTLIIFAIVSTITMMCIGLNYSNSKIGILKYESLCIEESLLSSIEIVHSNILKEVALAAENSHTEDEFKKYFLGNEFLNNIKSISNSQIKNVTVKIPTKIICDSNGLITFKIESILKKDNYLKGYNASVEIDTSLENYKETNDNVDVTSEDVININRDNETSDNEDEIIINPSDLVRVYDYKEI